LGISELRASHPMSDEPKRCETCNRRLVTVTKLARAVHSGCALTGERHDYDDCPYKQNFLLDARMLWKHMDRQDDAEATPSP
jgi:hypothetical protein